MAAFAYTALNERGREEKGVLEADSMRQARQILRDRSLAPLTVSAAVDNKEESARKFNLNVLLRPSLSTSDLALITRQIATLIAAALPVEEALLAVSRQTEKTGVETMLLSVRARVMEGYSLANSLAEFPRAFPALYRATVAAGESAGHLDLVLNRLADYTEARQQSRARIQQAMVYPIILFVLTLSILAGLMGYVVPDIVEVFAETGQELPTLTVAIIATSHFVAEWGIWVLFVVILIVIGCLYALRIPEIRLSWDRRLLHLPLVAKVSRGTNTALFSSTLSILTSSGVPLVDGMRIAGEVLSNEWLKLKIREATESVSEGASLNLALEASGYFPPIMLHMVASGENSGELDQMLGRVAVQMEQSVEMLMNVLLSLFGPLMLVVMGGAVFTIVMAILLPIINLNQLVGL